MKDDFAFIVNTSYLLQNFKEYTDYKAAQQAIKELNGYVIGGTRIAVEEARPKETDNSRISL